MVVKQFKVLWFCQRLAGAVKIAPCYVTPVISVLSGVDFKSGLGLERHGFRFKLGRLDKQSSTLSCVCVCVLTMLAVLDVFIHDCVELFSSTNCTVDLFIVLTPPFPPP